MKAGGPISLESFREDLLSWWRLNARHFPWREAVNRSGYRTAIAEIMLRRTRADQVVPVFHRYITRFPDLRSACRSDPAEIRELLYPLGLAWRAENMVAFLREACAQGGEDLPPDPAFLRALPGVGDYVAAAILCFAFNRSVALIDTNVVRVLGRVFGLDTQGEARRRRSMRDLAASAVDPDRPADYHYALLDFAAKVCLAGVPLCHICPMSAGDRCEYYRTVVRAKVHKDQSGEKADAGHRKRRASGDPPGS